jgi:hypothetical protein
MRLAAKPIIKKRTIGFDSAELSAAVSLLSASPIETPFFSARQAGMVIFGTPKKSAKPFSKGYQKIEYVYMSVLIVKEK